MSGAQIGSFAGMVIGSFFGPVGAQVGALVGGYIGGVIDPTIIKGPSIGDAQQQTSMGGMPIPKVYGHAPPIAPTLIDGDKVARKITRRQDVGKGATQKTETEAFIATRFFLVCESNGDALIARITRNGKLVYSAIAGDNLDATSASFAAQLTIYNGGPTQGPDPSLEAIHGVGNTPYYRKRLCFIVRDDDETQTGGAANQYRVEVIASGTSTQTCDEDGLIFHYPLDDAVAGGTARELIGGWDGTYSNNVDPVTANVTVSGGPSLNILSSGSAFFSGFGGYMRGPDFEVPSMSGLSEWSVSCWFSPQLYNDENGGGAVFKGMAQGHSGNFIDGTVDWRLALRYPNSPDEEKNLRPESAVSITSMTSTELSDSDPASFGHIYNMTMTFKENPAYAAGKGDLKLYVNAILVDEANDVSNSGTTCRYVLAGGGLSISSSYQFIGYVSDIKGYNFELSAEEVQGKYLDPNDWYPLPDIAGGYVDRFGNVINICVTRVTADSVQWKDIVSDIAGRASSILPAKLDIAHMTDEVPGFVLGRADLTAADYIRTLCIWGAEKITDLVEYDGQLHAIRRGAAIAGTLDEDDLLAVEDEDDDTRGQALDGYQRVTVMYPDPANNYVPTPQTAPRTSPDVAANSNVTLECPIPFGHDTMAQKADIMQKVAFLPIEGKFKRAFPAEYSKYVPSDAVQFRDRRYLLTKASYDEAMVTLEGTYDRPSAYTSVAKGTSPPAPEAPSGTIKGPTLLAVIQCNPLVDSDSDPGIYVAVRGLLSGWPGCVVQISIDGGVTFLTAATVTAPATMGRLVNAVSLGSSREPITVDLWGDDVLESVTNAQIAAGANLFAMISSGVSDIGQFQNASEDSSGNYNISTLTGNLKGTTEAVQASGDVFVLLDQSIVFIPIDRSLAGQTLYVRAITLGTAEANNDNQVTIVYDPFEIIVDGGEVTP